MAFNVLSGTISAYDLIASGTFSGSYAGDGSELINVKQFDVQNQGDQRVLFYKLVNGAYQLNANSGLTFNDSTSILSISDPKVGIGTAAPDGKLEVVSGNDANGTIAVRSGVSTQYSKISMGTNVNKATIGCPGANDTFFTDTIPGDLILRADDNNNKVHIGAGTSGPAGLVVTEHAGTDSRVGIGTASPSAKLEIVGNLKISTSLTASTAKLTGLVLGTATTASYLALDSNNNIVLTSSAVGGGGGGGSVNISNDGNNRLTTADGSGGIVGESNLTFDGSVLSVQGGLILKRRQITSTITASSTDYYIGVSSNGALSIRMPGAETLTSGQTFVVKDEKGNAHTHNVTILASGSQTIDGVASILLESPYAAVVLYTDGGSKYFVY